MKKNILILLFAMVSFITTSFGYTKLGEKYTAYNWAFSNEMNSSLPNCYENFTVNMFPGRDCQAFYVAGASVESFASVKYTITFNNNTVTTVIITDPNDGFMTSMYGYNCNFHWVTRTCASGMVWLNGELFYTPTQCWSSR